MSSTQHIDGNTLDEARNAHRQGISLTALPSQLQCDESHLANLLGLPQWRQMPVQDPDSEPMDLWPVDSLFDNNGGES